jgi:hypothetical protein
MPLELEKSSQQIEGERHLREWIVATQQIKGAKTQSMK